MTVDDFVRRHPRLFHMATAGALPQIQRYGLLSTKKTLEMLGVPEDESEKLLSQRRPQSVGLSHPEYGNFVLRDQKPMRDAALATCLEGVTIPDWYRLLNERVFMWATQERVETLLGARAYRSTSHLVLTIDTAKLVADHEEDLRLSSINSGATLYVPPQRGINTFCRLSDYELFNGRRQIVEVTVYEAIPRMGEYIIDATVRRAL